MRGPGSPRSGRRIRRPLRFAGGRAARRRRKLHYLVFQRFRFFSFVGRLQSLRCGSSSPKVQALSGAPFSQTISATNHPPDDLFNASTLSGSNPSSSPIITATRDIHLGCPSLRWQRKKDSNPHIRSQSPLCYLYTIPLKCLFCRGEDGSLPNGKGKYITNKKMRKCFFEAPICILHMHFA